VLSRNTVRVAEVARGLLYIKKQYIKIYIDNIYIFYIKESSFIGKKGQAVNLITNNCFMSSNLLSPKI
jgi:hypothetical protein